MAAEELHVDRDRRDLIERLAVAGVVLAIGACTPKQQMAAAPAPAARPGSSPRTDPEKDNSWDMSWRDRITGQHRQVFEIGELGEGFGLMVIRNWLNAHRDVWGLNSPDVTAVASMVSHGHINFNDATWAKFGFGEDTKTKEPGTENWATRNIFVKQTDPIGDHSVEVLQSRGVIFWQCNNALKGITAHVAKKMNMPPAEVRAELIAGLLPGVYHVPAHTMAIGLAQESGCKYESV